MTCDYGCGTESKYIFNNGKKCCSKHPRQCPEICKNAIQKRKNRNGGEWHNSETKEKIKKTSKLRTDSWNRGLNKEIDVRVLNYAKKLKGRVQSEYTRDRIRESKKGSIPWNKGLSSNDDIRILSGDKNGMFGRSHSEDTKQKLRELVFDKWSGDKNPWFGKNRSGENSPRWIPEDTRRAYKDYINKVSWLTELTFRKYHSIINPDSHIRTLCGVPDGWQLDHIVPISVGFKYGISPEVLSSVENLKMLPWEDNRKKHANLTEEANAVLKKMIERKI